MRRKRRATGPPASAHGARGRLHGQASDARPHEPHPEVLDGRPEGSLPHPAEAQEVGLVGEGDEAMQHGRGLGVALYSAITRGMPGRNLLLAQMSLQVSSTTATETASDNTNAAPNAITSCAITFQFSSAAFDELRGLRRSDKSPTG
jgi:hypothetical protein